MLPKVIQAILKAFLKNPNNIALRRKTFEALGQTGKRGKFNDPQIEFLAKEQNIPLKNLNNRTGMKKGAYDPKKDTSVGWKKEEFKAGQKIKRLKDISEGKGMNLPKTYKDPTLEEGGIEGLIEAGLAGEKSPTLGTTLRGDKSFIKGILSLARAAELYNPGTRGNILQKANLMKYKQQVEPYIAQLDDVERQIRYWLKEGDASDMSKVKNLMSQYAELKKSVDPKYWHARGMTWGHPAGLNVNVQNVKAKGVGADVSEYLATDPKALTRYDPEIGPLNIGKDSIDMTVLESISDPNIPVTRKGLSKMGDIYKQAGIRSIMPSPTGKKMILGEHNIQQQIDYLTKLLSRRQSPFAGLNKREIQKILTGYNKGGVVNGYAAGGIGRLGVSILKKLAKKMPEDDFLRVMETLWKGVDPKKSGRYKAWAKNRWSPGYKWPYQKSRIKGPEGSPRKHGEPTPRLTSHMADLSPGESVELQSKYADDIWEYKMKKKLGRDLYEDLEYPFLNPENDAFISTAPRTGLGRYQMRHFVDPENVGPVDKYQVYDWWDDILNRMRKKPKFKYVKDAKGKIVLKEVK